jgi:hypothetical protein
MHRHQEPPLWFVAKGTAVFRLYRRFRSLIAVIGGICLIVAGIPDTAHTFTFLANSARVVGHVVDSSPYTDSKGNVSYCPVLSYRTTSGRLLEAEAGQVCQGSPFTPGQTMALRYQNERPTSIRVDSLLGVWSDTIFVLGGGILIEALALIVFLWRRGRR